MSVNLHRDHILIPVANRGLQGENGQNGEKGQDGVTPVITATASVDSLSSENPTVRVTKTGEDDEPNFNFAFTGLKGNTIDLQTDTLVTSNWVSGSDGYSYSFENKYPSAQYDLFDIHPYGSKNAIIAFANAVIGGSTDSSIIYAYGDKPTIDIPIMFYTRRKA